MKDRTSFIIAHRLSTIRNADLILVMDEGDIVGAGDAYAAARKGRFYAELYNSSSRVRTDPRAAAKKTKTALSVY